MGKFVLKNIIVDKDICDIYIDGTIITNITKSGIQSTNTNLSSSLLCGGHNINYEEIDCTNMVAVPGFVNMHTHSAMTLFRGMEEDVVFKDWIKNIWHLEAQVDEDFVYWGSKVAALEMIKTGTTTFNDQYWYSPSTYKACKDMGIRPILSYVILDNGVEKEAQRQQEQCIKRYEESLLWHNNPNNNAKFQIAFHAIYSVSQPMILWASNFAKEHNLTLHIHLSETEKEVEDCKKAHKGLSPVEYLDSLGVLNNNVIAAHTLWLSSKDIEILGKRKVNCVHNINSNAKLSSGYRFMYNELKQSGANVCIGTDGCASSNNLDMLEAMKTSALFQKAWRQDPKAMPLQDILNMATINGAQALGLNTGLIKQGATADILIVNTNNTFFLSPGSFLANFIYSAHSDCIDSVIANGEFVMKHRKVVGEEQIIEGARQILKKIKTKQ